jgi:hypothetical protein
MKARIVYERNDGFDMQGGPFGYERVGFAIGDRVFWTGCAGSGMPGGTYETDKRLAETIVERWNAHANLDGLRKCNQCLTRPAMGHPTEFETSCAECVKRDNDRKWCVGK